MLTSVPKAPPTPPARRLHNTGRFRIGGVSSTSAEPGPHPDPEAVAIHLVAVELDDVTFGTLQNLGERVRDLKVSTLRCKEDQLPPSAARTPTVLVVGDEIPRLRRLRAASPHPILALTGGEETRRASRARLSPDGAGEVLRIADLTPPLLELAIDGLLRRTAQSYRLTELRERFALAIQGSKDGMWEWDLGRDRVFYSQRWKQVLGHAGEEVGQSLDDWMNRVHPHDAQRLRRELQAIVDGPKVQMQHEHRIRHADGDYRWVLARAVVQRSAEGTAVRIAGSLTDTTEYRTREKVLREQSRHDAITDLPKREAFLQRLARAVELARDHEDYMFCVLLIDVDRFRMIHDSMGTKGSDAVLGQLAKRIGGAIRSEDLLARFGGDKFSVLLENLDDPSEGTHFAKQIHEAMGEPFVVGEDQVYVSVSIGMTSSARGYANVDDVLSDVGAAAGKAKGNTDKRHEIFDTNMRIEALTLLRLEMALREAVEKEQFELHYQPIVDLANGNALRGFEALVRWQHPKRGRISPGEFIPLAESTGLIVDLGRFCLREAAGQLAAWMDEFELDDLSVSVNMSGRQTSDPNLLHDVFEAVKNSDLPLGALKLELTESVLMDNAEGASKLMQDLRDQGVKIWIDDFGTGYSSLSYLHRFPVDGLKIDKSFVDVLDGTAGSATMVRTVLDLAQNLGLDVIAEGIESEVQAAQLREMGCPLGQGYLFSRPLTKGDAYAIVARGKT